MLFRFHFKLCTLTGLIKHRYLSSVKFNFVERTVQIKTCGALYRKWEDQKLFSKVPKDDLVFNVPYIDISSECSNNTDRKQLRTVVALHGAPGSWRDFSNLSAFLLQHRCRVIAPSFPDFNVCRPGIFRHSHLEKAQYIKDFLKAISVSEVDLLVCHSSAVYPGLNLCLNNDDPKVKSLVLLNPGTFNLKGMSATRPINFLKAFVKASENPILLKILERVGPFLLKSILRVQLKFESILDPLLSATSMVNAQIPQSKKKFQQIVSQKLPLLFIFSENDPLVCTKPSYELAELFGTHPSDIFKYNNQGILIQQGKATNLLKIMVFLQGSHYVFLKYPEIVNKEIANFLDLQRNSC